MGDNQRVFLKLPPDMDPSTRDNFIQLRGMLEELSQGQVTKTSGISTNETSATTNATAITTHAAAVNPHTVLTRSAADWAAFSEKTSLHNDDLILIEDSEASGAKKKAKKSNVDSGGDGLATHIADVTTVHGKPNDKYDATSAPGVTNDVDEGYTPGSKWVDVTNDKEYTCLNNSDGAAVWTETTQSGGGSSYATDFSGTMSVDTTLGSGAWAKVGFDGSSRDNNSEFNVATDKWVCVDDGTYRISAVVCFDPHATGYRGAGIDLNGTFSGTTGDYIGLVISIGGNAKARVPVVVSLALTTGDTIEIQGFQNSGGNRNVDKDGSRFWVHRIQ